MKKAYVIVKTIYEVGWNSKTSERKDWDWSKPIDYTLTDQFFSLKEAKQVIKEVK
jgi:hypothetical protein